jgi:serine/threonine protein kinase
LESLGKGDFGEVYSARDKRTSETVAIKTFYPNKDNDWKRIQYHHEMKILPFLGWTSFDQPKGRLIVTPLMRCSVQHYIDMENRGVKLSEWTQTRKHIKLSRIVGEMPFMHEMSVIHQNLAPENLLLNDRVQLHNH